MVTEESTIQTETRNQYVFRVDPHANKKQIKDAVQSVFNVRVLNVNTMNYRGKKRRLGRTRRYGLRPSWKKAVVTLHEDDHIDLL
jgi:large subunit ribosomal protein L23